MFQYNKIFIGKIKMSFEEMDEFIQKCKKNKDVQGAVSN